MHRQLGPTFFQGSVSFAPRSSTSSYGRFSLQKKRAVPNRKSRRRTYLSPLPEGAVAPWNGAQENNRLETLNYANRAQIDDQTKEKVFSRGNSRCLRGSLPRRGTLHEPEGR